ncbi:hypothetical protein ACJ73_09782 [Blastomyces percursus]|uniref:Uncharacterized protein n=1 Tax=Blastomyces percursus TaxID=1658174 RepID=A0A1J9Q5P6_9EURO|nr:hypothetical protein ACJ73_09782 [Blastomyces percursus]
MSGIVVAEREDRRTRSEGLFSRDLQVAGDL